MKQAYFQERSAKDVLVGLALLVLLVLRVISIGLLLGAFVYGLWAICALLGIGGAMLWEHAAAVATVFAIPAIVLDKLIDFAHRSVVRGTAAGRRSL